MFGLVLVVLAAVSFEGRSLPLPKELKAQMANVSWHPGCPLGLDELSLVELTHWGYDGLVHPGRLVVASAVAKEVVEIFRALFDEKFPIERVRLIEDFGGSDDASMAANNTSAFNCRFVPGTKVLSKHSLGRAIDLNPKVNPYVRNQGVLPPGSEKYLDRGSPVPGMIRRGEACHRAFLRRGWTWGGNWRHPDYQHFEK